MAGQLWGTNSLGGYQFSLELSDTLRQQVRSTVKFRQLCDAKDFSSKGLHKGQTVTWNVYSKAGTAGTTLTEGTAIPQTNYTIIQGTATVLEWGNSVPFTSLVDYLSAHSTTDVVKNVLARDAREALDNAAAASFATTPLRAVATTGTASFTLYTNGTTTGTNTIALGIGHIRLMVDAMKERNIPSWDGDSYGCIGRPSTFRTVRNDMASLQQYTETGYAKIMNGEIGKVEDVRFIEQTNVASAAWTKALSDTAYFFGGDTVAEVMSIPPEIRGAIPSDYGRSLGVAWYALEGFGLVHADATNARIIKWDSLA